MKKRRCALFKSKLKNSLELVFLRNREKEFNAQVKKIQVKRKTVLKTAVFLLNTEMPTFRYVALKREISEIHHLIRLEVAKMNSQKDCAHTR